uniref:Uncharacterized protein n=1 Tax=Hyaloperonospora arabidopsidis (strain Emoy2) TaxID=559515 RepID=M4BYU2_HYAAE
MSRQLQVPTYVGSRLDRPEKSVDDRCGSCKGVITSNYVGRDCSFNLPGLMSDDIQQFKFTRSLTLLH